MRFKILFTSVLFLSGMNSFAQNFFRSYGNTDDEEGRSVVETKDTSYFIFGTSSSFVNGTANFYLINIDSLGNFKWSKTFGGAGIDQGYDICMKPNGHYLLTGYSNSYSNGYDAMCMEIDSLGNEIWTNNYGGADWDFAYSNVSLPTGEAIITGSTYSFGSGNLDGYMMMIADNGDSLWWKNYGYADEDVLRKTILTSSGELVSIGYTVTINGDKDFYAVKTQLDGDTIWTKKFGTAVNDEGFSVIEIGTGNYIFGGYSEAFGIGKDGYYFETDTSGNIIWTQNFGGNGEDIFNDLCYKPNSSRFYPAWSTNSFGNGDEDFVVSILTIPNGFYLGGNTYGSSFEDIPNAIIFTSNKRVLTVGTTKYPLGNSNILAVMSDTLFPTQSVISSYIDVTSIAENVKKSAIGIYPNPTHGITQINSDVQIKSVAISEIGGKMVYYESNLTSKQVNLQFLLPGIYLMHLEDSDGHLHFQKVIVTKQ
jgi:hypothetical protein